MKKHIVRLADVTDDSPATLIERLRDSEDARWLCDEAADEIERLRGTWVQVAERLPKDDGPYYWGWGPSFPEVELLEAWACDGVVQGFCHEAVGIVSGVTHWMEAIPPAPPA